MTFLGFLKDVVQVRVVPGGEIFTLLKFGNFKLKTGPALRLALPPTNLKWAKSPAVEGARQSFWHSWRPKCCYRPSPSTQVWCPNKWLDDECWASQNNVGDLLQSSARHGSIHHWDDIVFRNCLAKLYDNQREHVRLVWMKSSTLRTQHRHPNQQRKHVLDTKTLVQLEVNGLRAFAHRLKRHLDLKATHKKTWGSREGMCGSELP